VACGRGCGIRSRELSRLSELVARISGRPVPEAKPVVGAAAFRHESGIHGGGMLADARTYEPFAPEDVGHAPSALVIGRHSGTRLLGHRLGCLGLALPREALPALLEEVRQRATRLKRALTDTELHALAVDYSRAHALSHAG
jgi:homocitrate synthase NifV